MEEFSLYLEASDKEEDEEGSNVLAEARERFKREGYDESLIDNQLKYLLSKDKLCEVEIRKTLNLLKLREVFPKEYESKEVEPPPKKARKKREYVKVSKNLRERGGKVEVTDLDHGAEEFTNRRRVLDDLNVKTPRSCEINIVKEDFKRLSAAIHLWSFRVKGSVTWIRNNVLTIKEMRDILVFAGPRTSWNILKARPAETYLKMWKNTKQRAVYYCGHEESGSL